MTARDQLDRFLRTDPRDVGCDDAMEVVHVYADLVSSDPASAAAQLPGVAVHLAACGPCREDLTGLLAAVALEG